MTGRSWRHFSVFWPFMVAGLIGPPDDAGTTPASSLGRRHVAPVRPSVVAASAATHPYNVISDDGWVCVDGDDLAVEDEPLGEMPDPDVATSARYRAVFKDKPVHEAVLEMFCKAAELGGHLFGDNVTDETTLTEAAVRSIEQDAETLGIDNLQTLYGRTNTSKVHRLIYHLGDELRARGNLWEGDTSLNEKLHGACKRMYKRTNKRGPGVSLQMMRCEQTQVDVLKEIEEADGAEAAGAEDAVVTVAPTRTADLSFSGRGKRLAVGDLLIRPELQKFAEQLATDGVRWVTVNKTARIVAQFEWGATGNIQFVRATPSFMGKAWYSVIRYTSRTGDVRWGRAQLVVRSLGRHARSCVVVQRLRRIDARPGCVLTEYGCVRLAWDFDSVGDSFPSLELVDTTCILRLEDLQVDWRDLSDRHGLRAMPSTVPCTPIERRAARFFTNPFYPWTSRDLVPTL